MRRSLLVPTILLVVGHIPAAAAAGRTETIFQCSFGKKQVLVTRGGRIYSYSFGVPNAPEIKVVGDTKRNNIFVSPAGSMGTLDGQKYVRISNGRYSYVVFFDGLAKNYESSRATNESGLKVFDGTKRISKFVCTRGAGFQPSWDLSDSPPEDPDDLDAPWFE